MKKIMNKKANKSLHDQKNEVISVKCLLMGNDSQKVCTRIQNQFIWVEQVEVEEEFDPTAENALSRKIIVNNQLINIEIIPTIVHEFTAMHDQYIHLTDVAIIVFSITNQSSFEALTQIHEQILKVKDKELLSNRVSWSQMEKENERECSARGCRSCVTN